MKKILKTALVAVFAVCATSLYAQKFGRIDIYKVVELMPEMEAAQKQMETIQAEYEDQLESLQVEFNNKLNDFQKNSATLSESVKQLKQRELQELSSRIEDFNQMASEDLQKRQNELLAPVLEKVNGAIAKVAKADGMTAVFQNGSVLYLDENVVIDIFEKVKSELGIK